MNHILLLCLISLTGCAQGPNDLINGVPMFTKVDSELQPYFDQFVALSGVSVKGITAGFTPLSGHTAGECVWGGDYNEVRINSSDWNDADWTEDQKQQLISHELGHCALFLQHINDCSDGTTAPDGTESSCNLGDSSPRSIMNWQMFNEPQAESLTQSPGIYYQYLKLNQPIP